METRKKLKKSVQHWIKTSRPPSTYLNNDEELYLSKDAYEPYIVSKNENFDTTLSSKSNESVDLEQLVSTKILFSSNSSSSVDTIAYIKETRNKRKSKVNISSRKINSNNKRDFRNVTNIYSAMIAKHVNKDKIRNDARKTKYQACDSNTNSSWSSIDTEEIKTSNINSNNNICENLNKPQNTIDLHTDNLKKNSQEINNVNIVYSANDFDIHKSINNVTISNETIETGTDFLDDSLEDSYNMMVLNSTNFNLANNEGEDIFDEPEENRLVFEATLGTIALNNSTYAFTPSCLQNETVMSNDESDDYLLSSNFSPSETLSTSCAFSGGLEDVVSYTCCLYKLNTKFSDNWFLTLSDLHRNLSERVKLEKEENVKRDSNML